MKFNKKSDITVLDNAKKTSKKKEKKRENKISHANRTCDHDENNFRCVKYIKNYDGDTITFNIPGLHSLIGKKIKIRLSGVDTPEINTKDKCEKEKGQIAKRLVENLFKNSKRIDLENVKRGKYFRMVADVIIDGKSLTAYLLKNNLGYAYSGKKKRKIDWCNFKRGVASKMELLHYYQHL